MSKIRSIIEAFSMRPGSHHVYERINILKDTDGTVVSEGTIVDRIVLEKVICNDKSLDYYVGYDKENRRLFEYRKETVNVNYFV